MKKADEIAFWKTSAQEDKAAALSMYKTKHNAWSLFVWHIVIEKLLKGLLLSRGIPLVYTHDLETLAEKAGIKLTNKDRDELQEMTVFNLDARYDDYKQSFFKKATDEYVGRWIVICESWYKKLGDMYDSVAGNNDSSI